MFDADHSDRLMVNGCSLFIERRGHGPPLYAVHGGPGLDHTTLSSGMGGLESRFEVHYIDLRGHGRSDRCDPARYTFQQMADDLEEVRRQLEHERISLLGHSMGAQIVLLYALKYPRQIDSLVLVAASAAPPRFARQFLRAPGRVAARGALVLWALWNAMRMLIGRPWSLEESYRAYWANCWPLYTRRRSPPGHLRRLLIDSLKPPLNALPPLILELASLDLSRVLDQIRVRTLVVCGEEDVLFWRDQPQLCRIPGAQFSPIVDAGHFPHIDQPALFTRAVMTFLLRSTDMP